MKPADCRAWREEMGLTLQETADLLGVVLRTWQRWEAGEREPPPFLSRALRDIERELAISRR